MTDDLDRDAKSAKMDREGASKVFGEIDAAVRGRSREKTGARDAGIRDNERKLSILETLLRVSTAISSVLNPEEVLTRTVDAVIQITGCNRGLLLLRNDKTGGLYAALARSKDGEDLPHDEFGLSQSVVRQVAETGEARLVSNVPEESDLKEQRSIVDLNIKTVISIPLQFEGKLVGVIYADSDSISEKLTQSDLSVLRAFGSQAAVAIVNARRHGELESIRRSLEKQNVTLREELAGRYDFSGMVGRSRSMQQIFDVVRKVASLSTTVLIQGETGTGKELIAKAIHYNGARKAKPIVSVNCGAVPRDLLESELFGHRKGAFTGADQDRAGLFEAAHGGTIFLDEIGDMPMDLQVKLLRALQEGEVRRLGEEFSRSVDVRVISATNRDIAAEVEAGNFRRDLYYRLNVVPIVVPPLRDRQEDILPLAEFFLQKFAEEMKREKPILTRSAKESLLQHEWRGNVRELQNAIERALALAEGSAELEAEQFAGLSGRPLVAGYEPGRDSLKATLSTCEKEIIRKILIANSWNITQAAIILGISRQQLHSKIKKYGLSPII